MSPAQPSRKLFGITAHFSTQLFQSQPVGLFVPGQPFHVIVWAWDRIVAEELDHSRGMNRRSTVQPFSHFQIVEEATPSLSATSFW